jgi:hypothetical protein
VKNSNQRIEKIIFWDYGPGAMDILPVETVAQRLVDRWAAVDVAFHDGRLNSGDVRNVLKKIAVVEDNVMYCESVREYVIKTMIERYVKN